MAEGNEWEKLSPAISQRTTTADDLLSARRQERSGSVPAHDRDVLQDVVGAGESAQPVAASSSAPWTSAQNQPRISAAAEQPVATLAEVEEESFSRAEARQVAVADRPRWLGFRAFLIGLAVPILTLAVSVRAVATPLVLWGIYHRPGFPADSYGFSTEERMTFGSYGLDYILNFAPADYLSGLKTERGTNLFLTSEVQHMTEVKHVLLGSMIFALAVLLIALLASISLRKRAPGVLRKSLFWGAVSTLVIIAVLAVLAVLGWESFFTRFHELFFPQGNWQFRMSDTLIRLYPPQFWTDAAILVALFTLLIIVLLLVLTWPTKYRRELARRRAEERAELREKLSK